MSIFHDLGGADAVTAALDQFYPRVLADPRINKCFKGVILDALKKRIGPYMAIVIAGPNEHYNRDPRLQDGHLTTMRNDDSEFDGGKLEEDAFDAFVGHFEDVLKERGMPARKVAEIMPAFYETRREALCR